MNPTVQDCKYQNGPKSGIPFINDGIKSEFMWGCIAVNCEEAFPPKQWVEGLANIRVIFHPCFIVKTLFNFSFTTTGQKGFNVYKSVPYGPVGEALAYLGRRATENKDVIKRTEKERSLLWQELRRRITSLAH